MAKFHINWTNQFFGPSPFASEPLVVARLTATEPLSNEDVIQAATRLNDDFPYAENFREIVNATTDDALLFAGQFAANWALGILNEIRGFLHAAGALSDADGATVWVGYHHPELSRQALQIAVGSLQFILEGTPIKKGLAGELGNFFPACQRFHPDFQAKMLMMAAKDQDLPYLPFVSGSKLMQFGWGKNGRIFRENGSNSDGFLGVEFAQNKLTTKKIISEMGYPTPASVSISKIEDLPEAIKKIGFPCVLKPHNQGRGDGVTANIKSPEQATTAFKYARTVTDGPIIVERHLKGDDHRLMVIDGKLAIAIRREPSFVVGNGKSTIGELIGKINEGRPKNLTKSRYLKPIKDDRVLHNHLASQSVSVGDVLPAGKRISLRSNANRSTGGIATDVTDEIHPEIRFMAEQLANTFGLHAAGLDYLTTDLSKSPNEVPGGFIEVNKTPGMCVCVAAGMDEIEIGKLCLGKGLGDIPVNLTIVNPDALEMTCSEYSDRPARDGVALVCGNNIWMDGVELRVESNRPWEPVNAALKNRTLWQLEIICTGSDIQQFGLPVDRITNVKNNDPSLPDNWKAVLEGHSIKS